MVRRGNLVPKTWSQSATFGSFIGSDAFSGFLEKGLQEAAGIVDGLDDLAPVAAGLAGQAGDLAKGLGDQLPGMQDQLKGMAENLAPQLESIAKSSEVTQLGAALKDQAGAFANLGKGLVPTGY